MHLKSILNRIEPLKSFVYKEQRLVEGAGGQPYLKVIREQIPQAVHVLDRLHIMRNMNKAIDEVRRQEVAQLKRDGYEPILTHSRWCLLKRPENLTDHQAAKLKDLLHYNLKSVRAHLLRESFQLVGEYVSPGWAAKYLESWSTRVLRGRLKPMRRWRAVCGLIGS